ncbi:MAG: prolyl-tRNA synthetase [Parcubacteria group bacterium LiPW_15]|nr:MAG: prolyl-tRNA synthetase [Parcubacteria group bacterium LiPW_15]
MLQISFCGKLGAGLISPFCDKLSLMLQSKLFTKTLREAPKDEEALNAKLLLRAGFVDKLMAGVYTFLPLGLRVLNKIETVIREEMNAIGGQEVLMPALQPKENWEATGRWNSFEALYKTTSRFGGEYALGPTHEEIIVPLGKKFIFSYKDLPFAAYQIQTKFRDEKRPKGGLLRGREFKMKDLYSFHTDPEDLLKYYAKALAAYKKIFKRLGLKALVVEASGGTFSKYSHEFQVLSPGGEDLIYVCSKCDFAKNKEIVDEAFVRAAEAGKGSCPNCGGKVTAENGIEVGNIFQLNTKYSDPFALKYKDEKGEEKIVYMGCYGIGVSRLLGTIAEIYNDEKGLVWPKPVAPFAVHLLELNGASAKKIYAELTKAGIEVLYDDRKISAGAKLNDSDLLGIPYRIIVSPKTGARVEFKERSKKTAKLVNPKQLVKLVRP